MAIKLSEVRIENLCTDLKINSLENAYYLNYLSELGMYFWAIADDAPWCAYFFIDKQKQLVVGNGGFKGAPQKSVLEIGYEVNYKFYRNGYATEAVAGLLKVAASKKIKAVIAETNFDNIASERVLKKNGFIETKKFRNDDGEHICHFVRKFA